MGYINGEIRILYIKVVDDYLPIGCLTSNSFSEGVETIEGTSKAITGGWTSTRLTNQSYNISFDGLVLNTDIVAGKVTYNDLRVLKRGRTLIEWKIDDGVLEAEIGSGYITNLSDSASIDEFVSFSGSIVGFGLITTEANVIYDAYAARVAADGGGGISETCLKTYINSIL